MKQLIREHLIDCSDQEKFVFNLICPECGKVWQSTPVGFSKAEEDPRTESKQVVFICFMSGKRKGLSTRRWRKRAISSICVHYASAWCATTASLFARRLMSAAGVQSGCRKQENRFRLWTGAPHEDHCGEKIG